MEALNQIQISDTDIVKFIKQICAIYFEMPDDIYDKKTRKMEVIKVKHYAIYFCQKHTNLTFENIAKIFKLKTHSSVNTTISKIDGLLDWDRITRKEVQDIEAIIRLRGLAKGLRIDLEKYYFINMDTLKSHRQHSEKAILFIGYTDEEIKELIGEVELREHRNTKKYILEDNKKD
jgi:uncharacterized pyridoxamine 5'-phosphate oxidase family protein